MLENWLAQKLGSWRSASELVMRIATSLIFIIGGLGHFFRPEEMLARMQESPWMPVVAMLGDPLVHLWLSGAVFVLAGLFLAIGYSTRLAALALFLVLIPVTISIHVVPDSSHVGPLFKNVAILGALFHYFVNGAACCAVDMRFRNQAR